MSVAFITADPIDLAPLLASVVAPDRGGIASFLGLVRDHHEGRAVLGLAYSAYGPMAEVECSRIVAEAQSRWRAAVSLRHRVGMVAIGDAAVAVVAASAHRDEAFAACRYVIEEVKRRVPGLEARVLRRRHGSVGGTHPQAAARMTPIDTLGRPLRSLRISVTDRCNMRCGTACRRRSTCGCRGSRFSASRRSTGSLACSPVSGCGSPAHGRRAALRHDLPAWSTCSPRHREIDDIALTTNGILLARSGRGASRAGLRRVTVSLDTLQPDADARVRQERAPRRGAHRDRGGARGRLRSVKLNAVVIRGLQRRRDAGPAGVRPRARPSRCASSSTWTSAARRSGKGRRSWPQRGDPRPVAAPVRPVEPARWTTRGRRPSGSGSGRHHVRRSSPRPRRRSAAPATVRASPPTARSCCVSTARRPGRARAARMGASDAADRRPGR